MTADALGLVPSGALSARTGLRPDGGGEVTVDSVRGEGTTRRGGDVASRAGS